MYNKQQKNKPRTDQTRPDQNGTKQNKIVREIHTPYNHENALQKLGKKRKGMLTPVES